MTNKFKPGDRIIYTYRHWLNSKSSTLIRRNGAFVRYVKSRKDGKIRECVVQIDTNKYTSTVSIYAIRTEIKLGEKV